MVLPMALPRIMRVGSGASLELPDLLKQLGLSRPFVMTDPVMVELGKIEPLLSALTEHGFDYRLFSDTVAEPNVASILLALENLQQGACDCLVAFGGGSPIDSAKAVSVLASRGGQIADYKAPHLEDRPALPIIAIPTTAGTGSEATRFTVITDEEHDEKMLCMGLAYLPTAALIDYELTLTKPRRLTADTGIDALTHALEAYVSKRANPLSNLFALEALRLIAPNLRKVWVDGMNREAREAIMLGATYAGIAFSNSSVALVHGMSRPVGAHFHVPHGLSNAMLLPLVTRFSAPSALSAYARCGEAIGVARGDEGEQMTVNRLVDELSTLNAELEVPGPRAYGITRDKWFAAIPIMAKQALASGSPSNNPRVPSIEELSELYEQAWEIG